MNLIIVEDEPSIASLLEQMVHDLGFKVLGIAATVSEGLKLADHPDIDFAIVNLNLHGEMAIPIADRLLERTIPFIFASGYDRDRVPPRHQHVFVLEKPFTFASLKAALPRRQFMRQA
jgi:DNA-binding response OmpR family regulator